MSTTCVFRVLVVGIAAATTTSAPATFHFMQIEQVIGGVGGDTTVQAIQLRMRSPLPQNLMQNAKLWVRDATGSNPILLIDFTTPVPIGTLGTRVLITSANFSNSLDGPLTPDYTLTNLIPASYLAAGSITFENNLGTQVLWRLSWGGAAYTGPTTGLALNDDDGDFGPPWPDPLPSAGTEALLFGGSVNAKSTTNAADYALTPANPTFFNNAGASARVVGPACPWDCDGSGDGNANVSDLLALLGQWDITSPVNCTGGSCDYNNDGCTDVVDLLKLLANYATDPAGVGCP